MATKNLSLDEIDALSDDVMEAIMLLDDYGIDSEGVNDVEEAQKRLRALYVKQNGNRNSTSNDITKEILNLPEIIETNEESRQMISEAIQYVKMFLDKIPPKRCKGVEKIWPNAAEKFESHLEELENVNPVILIAGETSAGKSSLLNLLLGDLANNILPVSHLSSTSVISELKYGEKRRMIAHPRRGTISTKTLELTEEDASKILSEFIHQTGDRDRVFPYKKVEIFWPCEWLKGGVTIVDSPGVGEDDELTEMVKEYIPRASGFVYVINTPNAGGIDPDRLQDLMLSHLTKDNLSEDKSDFMPSTAMFVCNKWDQIPSDQREAIKDSVFVKLRDIWPQFSEQQLFFISLKQTVEELQQNLISDNYRRLLKGFETLIPVSFNARLSSYYRFSKKVMERLLLDVRSFVKNENDDVDKRTRLDEVKERLMTLKTRTDEVQNTLELALQREMSTITDDLTIFLNSAEAQANISLWDEKSCPKWVDDEVRLQQLQQAYAYKRIKKHISEWDNQNKRYQQVYQRLLQSAKCYSANIEAHIKDIEDQVTNEKAYTYMKDFEIVDALLETPVDLSTNSSFTGSEYSAVWVPLVMAFDAIMSPFKRMRNERQMEQRRLEYAQTCCDLMKKKTIELIQYILKENRLANVIEDKYSRLMIVFQRLFSEIPKIIEADEMLLSQLAKTLELADKNRKECSDLLQSGEKILGNLDFIYLTRIADRTSSVDEYSDWVYINEGVYARVYKATTKKDKETKYVALKVNKKPITLDNATELLAEEFNLLTLQGTNVIGFYGTVLNKIGESIFPVFVMEFCSGTLDKIIYSESYKAPGFCDHVDSEEAIKIATSYAIGLASGLAHIHRKGFLHRDLKPENILVTNGEVKIGDLGLAKEIDSISGTLLGTPLYMAPEVWEENVYSEKADMFSYGMVIWEIWYGCDVNVKLQCKNIAKLVEAISTFATDPFLNTGRKPHPKWQDIMIPCWSSVPMERPSAYHCWQHLKD